MTGFLHYLKTKRAAEWLALKKAEAEGLIFINEEQDSVCSNNRLLSSYPTLQDMIACLLNDWVEQEPSPCPIQLIAPNRARGIHGLL